MLAMQVLASKIIGRWVIDRSHARPLGEVAQLYLDPKQLRIAYYKISTPGERTARLLRADQADLQESLLTVGSENSLGERDDFLRDQALLDNPCLLLGWRVIDRNKKRIGRVSDYSLSSTSSKVDRLIVGVPLWQRFFTPERIISSQQIYDVDVSKKLIVIKHDQSPLKTRATEAVPA